MDNNSSDNVESDLKKSILRLLALEESAKEAKIEEEYQCKK